jgi:hypothetical protein
MSALSCTYLGINKVQHTTPMVLDRTHHTNKIPQITPPTAMAVQVTRHDTWKEAKGIQLGRGKLGGLSIGFIYIKLWGHTKWYMVLSINLAWVMINSMGSFAPISYKPAPPLWTRGRMRRYHPSFRSGTWSFRISPNAASSSPRSFGWPEPSISAYTLTFETTHQPESW